MTEDESKVLDEIAAGKELASGVERDTLVRWLRSDKARMSERSFARPVARSGRLLRVDGRSGRNRDRKAASLVRHWEFRALVHLEGQSPIERGARGRETLNAPAGLQGNELCAERRRIGRWPDIPPGVLGDFAVRARGGCLVVWRGRTGIQRPFLILRQRQNPERRGGYPFCVLLDPDDGIWERFGWNGAALADAIVSAPREAMAAFARHTRGRARGRACQRFTGIGARGLSELVRTLRQDISHSSCRDGRGSLQSKATTADLRFGDDSPLPSWTAAAVNDLPVPFRTGNG